MRRQATPRAHNIRVLIAGTFDCLHAGHLDFFRQAQLLGQVIAIVARDHSVQKIKRRTPRESERTRLAKVARNPHITRARLGHATDFVQPLLEEQPDIIALGYDQKTFSMRKLQYLLKASGLRPRIVRLKSFQPTKFKTSLLRNQ